MLRNVARAAAILALAVTITTASGGGRASAQERLPQLPTQGAAASAGARTGDVIVRFRTGTTLQSLAGAVGRANASVRASTSGSGLVLVQPAAGESVDAAVARLQADPSVEFAEPNTTVHATAAPNDPLYATYGASLQNIGVPTAWNTTTGSASVTVAVLDTGVDATHEDLTGGRVVAGYNFVANNTNTADDHFHGTFVAGIIGATANNGLGIAGVCWSCKIMPVKVLDSGGNGSMFQAAQGIDWAVQHGAQVINMSFGGASADAGLQTAVNNAWNAGVVLVAAAGNDNHGPVLYPAAFSNVVAVGSLDVNGNLSAFSNVGPQIDVMAPGEDIASTLCTCHGYTGGYATGDGTSFASPEVAGIAALMIAAGTTNNATIVSRLDSTAVNLEAAGFDNDTGWGRVNAAGAVGADTTPPTVSITSPAAGATVSGVVSITASASDNAAVQKVQLWVDGTYLGYDTSAPYTKTWNAAGKNGRHTVIARAVDWANNRSTTSISITVSNADSTPPTVSITAPADDATVTGVVTIAANASDAGGVQKVQFWAGSTYLGYDTAAPYTRTWDVTSLPFGVYAIEARAVDWRGNTTDAVVNVRVGNDVSAPSVTLTAPGDGASVSGTVSIQATASDDVQVEKVRIWIDGAYKGYDVSAPYGWTWDTTALSNGAHSIRVQAIDTSGNASADATANVVVSN